MKPVLLPLATSVLFSGSYVAGKYTTLDLGPLTTTALRYLIALAFLLSLLAHYRLSSLRVAARDLPALLGLGVSGIVGYHYFFFMSLRHTEVANTAIINALAPVASGIAAAVFIGERLSVRSYVGVAVALLGVLVLLCDADPQRLLRMRYARGDLLMLAAVACWTAYALLIKRLSERYSGYTLTFYATLFGVIALLGLVPREDPLEQIRAMSRASALSLVYMGIGASGVGYLLYNLSIRELGPTATASFVYAVVAILVAGLGFAFFGEPITGAMAAAAGLVLIGLRLTLRQV